MRQADEDLRSATARLDALPARIARAEVKVAPMPRQAAQPPTRSKADAVAAAERMA